jgi:hypothetical protein
MRFKKSIPFFSHISHSHHIPYILCLIVIGVILIVIVVIVDVVDVVVVVYFPSLVHSVSHPSRSPTTPSSSAICLPGSSARFVSTLLSLDLLLFLSDLPIFRDKYAPPPQSHTGSLFGVCFGSSVHTSTNPPRIHTTQFRFQNGDQAILAHFHEWLAGVGLVLVRIRQLQVSSLLVCRALNADVLTILSYPSALR